MGIGVYLLMLLILPTECGECANTDACRMTIAGQEHRDEAHFLHDLALGLSWTERSPPLEESLAGHPMKLCIVLMSSEPRLHHVEADYIDCQLVTPAMSLELQAARHTGFAVIKGFIPRELCEQLEMQEQQWADDEGRAVRPAARLLRAFLVPQSAFDEPFVTFPMNSSAGAPAVRFERLPMGQAEVQHVVEQICRADPEGLGAECVRAMTFHVRNVVDSRLMAMQTDEAWAVMPDVFFHMGDPASQKGHHHHAQSSSISYHHKQKPASTPVTQTLPSSTAALIEAMVDNMRALGIDSSPGAESIAMAFNTGRLELALNNIETLRAAGVLHKVVIVTFDEEAGRRIAMLEGQIRAHVRLYQLVPESVRACFSSDESELYGGLNFAVVTRAKLLAVAALLELGHRVLFLDADVVVFSDPLKALNEGAGIPSWPAGDSRREGDAADLMFQYGGSEPESYPAWERQYASGLVQTFPLLNTGVIYAQPTDNARRAMRAALALQGGLDSKPKSYVDDQVAVNEVVFSRRFMGLEGLRVKVLDPWVWTSRWFYVGHLQGRAPPGPPNPVLLHLYGCKTGRRKAEILGEMGLWFLGGKTAEAF